MSECTVILWIEIVFYLIFSSFHQVIYNSLDFQFLSSFLFETVKIFDNTFICKIISSQLSPALKKSEGSVDQRDGLILTAKNVQVLISAVSMKLV